MGNQLTETKEEFSNKAGVRQRYHFQDTAGLNLPQPYNLNDHHKEGPSKVSTTFCGYNYINYWNILMKVFNLFVEPVDQFLQFKKFTQWQSGIQFNYLCTRYFIFGNINLILKMEKIKSGKKWIYGNILSHTFQTVCIFFFLVWTRNNSESKTSRSTLLC